MRTGARTVTILFTDLVGSTELLQKAGYEQAQRILKPAIGGCERRSNRTAATR